MIKIKIHEDIGELIVNGPALDLMTDEEYQQLDELGKGLKSRLKSKALKETAKGGVNYAGN